ncbi:hypothetical protein PAXRUDRAFT_140624 [Paxillus rubicundulus Ve08.2h10]|uniref:Unplaced genomic scaffold scaffold_219, whole genome shotgun sequence n=1 Tax=Paxillus rubicundulus Ve08.2h10 TaxID=930991 RepID=A0A0D0E963_9AGAM|nr:hypothetical protein PAXRUDRAFT_140624 [Paxillus rubicundulus Ve08.2h10]
MHDQEVIDRILNGVDVQAAAAAFYANSAQRTHQLVASSLSTCPHIPCPPRQDARIELSPLHPPVLTSDCVLLWSTPTGIQFQRDLESQFSHSSVFKLFQVMLCSLDKDICGNYGAGLLCFTQFCDSQKISEVNRMPASTSLLSAFASAHAGTVSDKTVSNWLAGLHFWHVVNHTSWNTDGMLHHICRGVAKMVSPSSKCSKHPPITLEALIILGKGLDSSSYFDSAIWATTCITFWSCCRLGELLIPSPNLFSPQKHISHSVLPLSNCFLTNKDLTHFCSFHIPWTKTTRELGTDISITYRPHITCPFITLHAHLTINSDLPSSAPLFSFKLPNRSWQALTKPEFMRHCNQIWVEAGFPSMPGHAFHISGATELLLQGVSPDVVAQQGRWKSQAFLEYWCCIESILPLFISSSSSTSCCLALDDIMLDFICCNQLTVHPSSS